MPAYDSTHFDPPAPVAKVNVRNPATYAGVQKWSSDFRGNVLRWKIVPVGA